MTTNPHTYTIIDGPTMHDILTSMLDGIEIPILTDTGRIRLLVNVIEREDGSGTSFNITGHVTNVNKASVTFYARTEGVGGPIVAMTA